MDCVALVLQLDPARMSDQAMGMCLQHSFVSGPPVLALTDPMAMAIDHLEHTVSFLCGGSWLVTHHAKY